MSTATVTFTIPVNLWLTSNRQIANRGYRQSIVAGLHKLAATEAANQGLEKVDGQVYVDWEVCYPKGVRRDVGEASNAQPATKALLDGLVHAGYLVDDGPKYVVAETFRRGPNLTVPRLHTVRLVLTPQEVPWT